MRGKRHISHFRQRSGLSPKEKTYCLVYYDTLSILCCHWKLMYSASQSKKKKIISKWKTYKPFNQKENCIAWRLLLHNSGDIIEFSASCKMFFFSSLSLKTDRCWHTECSVKLPEKYARSYWSLTFDCRLWHIGIFEHINCKCLQFLQ